MNPSIFFFFVIFVAMPRTTRLPCASVCRIRRSAIRWSSLQMDTPLRLLGAVCVDMQVRSSSSLTDRSVVQLNLKFFAIINGSHASSEYYINWCVEKSFYKFINLIIVKMISPANIRHSTKSNFARISLAQIFPPPKPHVFRRRHRHRRRQIWEGEREQFNYAWGNQCLYAHLLLLNNEWVGWNRFDSSWVQWNTSTSACPIYLNSNINDL